MQTKEQLEQFYKQADPWGFKVNDWDEVRKRKIIQVAEEYGPFKKALDVGAGEGWITEGLPADELYGYEISDEAAERFPKNVKRFNDEGRKKFDLIVACGVFYEQYDHEAMKDLIKRRLAKGGKLITSNIKSWELPIDGLEQIFEEEYQYREFTQKLRVYETNS